MNKLILLFTFLLSINLFAQKEWVAPGKALFPTGAQITKSGQDQGGLATSGFRILTGTGTQQLAIGYDDIDNFSYLQSANGAATPLLLNPLGGSVGVGTDTPLGTLHLSSNSPELWLTDKNASTGTPTLRLIHDGSNTAFQIYDDSNVYVKDLLSINSATSTATLNGSLRIPAGSNLNENVLARNTGTTAFPVLTLFKNGAGTSPNQTMLLFSISQSATGYVDAGGIRSTAGGTPSFLASSDRRVKTVEGDMSPVLEKINSVELKKWTRKDATFSSEGPIAQQLHAVFPSKVVPTDDGLGEELPEGVTPWTISTDFTWELMKAIQELSSQRESDKQLISSLVSRIEALESN